MKTVMDMCEGFTLFPMPDTQNSDLKCFTVKSWISLNYIFFKIEHTVHPLILI